MSIGLDPEHGQAPGLEHERPVLRPRASGSLNGSSVDTDLPGALASSGLGVRVIVKDASVVGLPASDVSMVLIHDRLVILPIPAYLARETGFTLVEGYPEVLAAAGVRMGPDEGAVGVHVDEPRHIAPQSNGAIVVDTFGDTVVEPVLSDPVSLSDSVLSDSVLSETVGLDAPAVESSEFDPDAPVAAAQRVEEVSAARRVETQLAATQLPNLPVGVPSHQGVLPTVADHNGARPQRVLAVPSAMAEVPQFEATDATVVVRATGVLLRDTEAGSDLLDDVSVDITVGEFVVLRGASAQSCALLSVLAGLETPQAGDVWRHGVHLGSRTPAELDRHCAIAEGVLSTSIEPHENDTIVGFVERPLLLLGFSKAASRNRAIAVLRRFGIVDELERPVDDIHGIPRERIAIAHGMVGDPKVLWIEDPAGTLAPVTAGLVVTLARTLHRQGRTVVATGDDPALLEVATRIVTIVDGYIVADHRTTP